MCFTSVEEIFSWEVLWYVEHIQKLKIGTIDYDVATDTHWQRSVRQDRPSVRSITHVRLSKLTWHFVYTYLRTSVVWCMKMSEIVQLFSRNLEGQNFECLITIDILRRFYTQTLGLIWISKCKNEPNLKNWGPGDSFFCQFNGNQKYFCPLMLWMTLISNMTEKI